MTHGGLSERDLWPAAGAWLAADSDSSPGLVTATVTCCSSVHAAFIVGGWMQIAGLFLRDGSCFIAGYVAVI